MSHYQPATWKAVKYKPVIFCILLFWSGFALGSPDAPSQKKLIQLSGSLRNDVLQPLNFAHILVLSSYRGTITDREGQFSIVVEKGDSIMLSSLGYKKRILVIGDSLPNNFLYVDLFLERDTFMIGEVEIYPWKSYEEFKKAFLNLELPSDDMDHARQNIALLRTQIILDQTPSARANFQHILDEQYRQTFTRGQYPTYQILNPFAWAEFFKALKRGDFTKYSEPGDS